MNIPVNQLNEILKSKLGDKEAETLIGYIKEKAVKEINDESDLSAKIENVRLNVVKTRYDIIRWILIFWFAQLVIQLAIIKFLLP